MPRGARPARSGRLEVVRGRAHAARSAPPGPALTADDHGPLAALLALVLSRGSAALARSYCDGEWSLRRPGEPGADRRRGRCRASTAIRRPAQPAPAARSPAWPRNTRDRARTHVAAHYDLGDDLFETLPRRDDDLLLCGLRARRTRAWPRRRSASSTRSAASSSSARTITCSRSAPAGARFAIHAAGALRLPGHHHHDLARAARHRHRAGARGRARDRVEVLLEDYRDLRGRYDKLVSVEMIEAVGWQYFDEYFRRCGELLGSRRPDGAAGDPHRRRRVRGGEGHPELHQRVHLPLGLPPVHARGGGLHQPRHRSRG